jgi:hypothetical protein
MGEMQEFKFCYHGPGDPVQEFWRFYEAKLGLAPKIKILPHDLFYKHVNLKKIQDVGKYFFQSSKQS